MKANSSSTGRLSEPAPAETEEGKGEKKNSRVIPVLYKVKMTAVASYFELVLSLLFFPLLSSSLSLHFPPYILLPICSPSLSPSSLPLTLSLLILPPPPLPLHPTRLARIMIAFLLLLFQFLPHLVTLLCKVVAGRSSRGLGWEVM